jgi:hypothetical protein
VSGVDAREVTGSSRESEGSVVAIPEESPTVAKGGVRGAGSGVRVGRGRVPVWRVVFSGRFVQETDLGEPLTAVERTSRRGLIRGPEKAGVQGGNPQSCTLVVLFSRTAPEEPFATAEGFDLGLEVGDRGRPPCREDSVNMHTLTFVHLIWSWRSRRGSRRGVKGLTSRFEGPRSWRKPRVAKAETRSNRGPSDGQAVGPGGNQQGPKMVSKSQEKAMSQEASQRKRPRPKSLRPRNSSGSLTS